MRAAPALAGRPVGSTALSSCLPCRRAPGSPWKGAASGPGAPVCQMSGESPAPLSRSLRKAPPAILPRPVPHPPAGLCGTEHARPHVPTARHPHPAPPLTSAAFTAGAAPRRLCPSGARGTRARRSPGGRTHICGLGEGVPPPGSPGPRGAAERQRAPCAWLAALTRSRARGLASCVWRPPFINKLAARSSRARATNREARAGSLGLRAACTAWSSSGSFGTTLC